MHCFLYSNILNITKTLDCYVVGVADCPYYAKVELLADNLERNLSSFNLHKIVIQPDEWKVRMLPLSANSIKWVNETHHIRGSYSILVKNKFQWH